MNTRSTDEGPFAWASKEALRCIHDHFSETNNLPSAFAVYLALCVIASNKQSETFIVKRSDITSRSGVGVRTLDFVLAGLVALKLVQIEQPYLEGTRLKAASTYTLLSIGNGRIQPFVAHNLEESKRRIRRRRRGR